jgi:hypothetical protein
MKTTAQVPAIALLASSATTNNLKVAEQGQTILLKLCDRLPASVLADMVAQIIATDIEGESESASDFLCQVGMHRFGTTKWQMEIRNARESVR